MAVGRCRCCAVQQHTKRRANVVEIPPYSFYLENDMSHTPGPWQISDDHGKRWIETLANDDTICEVHRRDTRVGRERDEQFHANARLIESAPDLLAQLKNLHRAYVNLLEAGHDRIISLGGDCDPVERMERDDPYLRAAKAVIAKATT